MANLEFTAEQDEVNIPSYANSAIEAKSLVESFQELPFGERELALNKVLKVFLSTNEEGEEFSGAVELMTKLVKSSVLTPQQLGTILRAWQYLSHEPITKGENIHLSQSELMAMQIGNFDQAASIFRMNPVRAHVWEKSIALQDDSTSNSTVYRCVQVTDSEAQLIQQYGFVPEGLRQFGKLEKLIEGKAKTILGLNDEDDEAGVRNFLMSQLPISRLNLLKEVYINAAFGSVNPFKLGISTTTPENLRNQQGRFFGNHLFRITLPNNLLIHSPNEGGNEDERTILYYISPEAITGHEVVSGDNIESAMRKLI